MLNNILYGIVIKNVCSKTLTVLVSKKVWHSKYRKIIKCHRKYLAHDEENKYCVGERVMLELHSPFSAKKKWLVIGNVRYDTV